MSVLCHRTMLPCWRSILAADGGVNKHADAWTRLILGYIHALVKLAPCMQLIRWQSGEYASMQNHCQHPAAGLSTNVQRLCSGTCMGDFNSCSGCAEKPSVWVTTAAIESHLLELSAADGSEA